MFSNRCFSCHQESFSRRNTSAKIRADVESDRGAWALDITKRSLQTCGQIFRYAIAHGFATRNPATDTRPSDVMVGRRKQNDARLDAKELPKLLRHIEVYQGSSVTHRAMKFMVMTFVRTSERIGARSDISSERMKMRTRILCCYHVKRCSCFRVCIH